MHVRVARKGPYLWLVCLSLAACGGDKDPATIEDVISACHDYGEAACRAFADCIGLSEQEVTRCIADGDARCGPQRAPEWCWDAQRDAYDDCAGDVDDRSCDVLCDGASCMDECRWVCPPQPPDA